MQVLFAALLFIQNVMSLITMKEGGGNYKKLKKTLVGLAETELY